MHYYLRIIEVSLTTKAKAKFPESSCLTFQEFLAQGCSKRKTTLSICSTAIAEEWKRPILSPKTASHQKEEKNCSCAGRQYSS